MYLCDNGGLQCLQPAVGSILTLKGCSVQDVCLSSCQSKIDKSGKSSEAVYLFGGFAAPLSCVRRRKSKWWIKFYLPALVQHIPANGPDCLRCSRFQSHQNDFSGRFTGADQTFLHCWWIFFAAKLKCWPFYLIFVSLPVVSFLYTPCTTRGFSNRLVPW